MSSSYFPDYLSEFIFVRTYSRYIPESRRRETFPEMVERVINYYQEVAPELNQDEFDMLKSAMLKMEVMPSMRLAWTAGEAARKNNIGIYNCSYLVIDQISSFAEIMFLLMHGTGVGYSVEKEEVEKLPVVQPLKEGSGTVRVKFEDSKEGWARGLLEYLKAIWAGYTVEYDVSEVRPEGAPLNTFGGRASGPAPLIRTLDFCKKILEGARGRKILPIEAHDIATKIAESIVSGGVRRSAMISLSDLHDKKMSTAKMGEFWNHSPHRTLSNNSAVYAFTPDEKTFWMEWSTLIASQSGERGIFNRKAAKGKVPRRETFIYNMGTNPCAEIILRPREFCNLTSVVVRPSDTPETLKQKVTIASMMGTIQARLQNFGYLNELSTEWQKNVEEERLLGVSLTGVMDHPTLVKDKETLRMLRETAVDVNKAFSDRLMINPAAAVTCIKPEGTSSTLNSSAPGQHARYSPYYLRHVRINATDPLYKLMKDQGVPFYPEVGSEALPESEVRVWVAAFPVASPESAVTVDKLSALDQLENWYTLNKHWAEHSVSATISVGPEEWGEVGGWVYDHFDEITGLSFLPRADHVYKLAPYQPITKEEYETAKAAFPEVDYSLLSRYEYEDHNQGVQTEWACSGGSCDIL